MSKSKNIEMITGDPKKAIVKLALPMMLSMLLIMLYNIADSIWVAGLGPDALAAVGFITPLFMVLVGLGNGIGAGANSLIARNIGAKKLDQANNAGLHAIVLSIIVSLIFTVLIEVFMVPILQFMGAGHTIQYAMDYSYIIFGFIYVLNLGISGAAWATVVSATLSCLVMSYWIWVKKDLFLDLSPKNFSYSGHIMIDTLQVAIPSTLETIVFSALAIIINSMLVLAAGTTAVAVYTASMRIVQLAMIPLIGIGTAVLTVSGVAYGAHNYKNLQTSHSYSIKIGFAVSIALGAIMFVFSGPIAAVFSYTQASAGLASEIATAISVLSLFVLAIPHGIMSSMMFQGVGKGTYSLLITLLRSLILESVFAYLFCFVFGWGLPGIYGGVVFGCFLGGTIGYIWAKLFIRKFKEISIKKYEKHEENSS